MRHRQIFRAALLLLCGSVVAVPIASPTHAQAAPNAQVLAPQWGVLARLAGTTWLQGKDQVTTFTWYQPGVVMMMTTRGLWGKRQLAIHPNAAGTSLVAVERQVESGKSSDQTVAVARDTVTFSSAQNRLSCRLGNAQMQCRRDSSFDGHSWSIADDFAYVPGDQAGANALLAALPAIFPPRAPGSFDRVTGAFGLMTGSRWISKENDEWKVVEAWTGKQGTSIDALLATFDTNGFPTSSRHFWTKTDAPLSTVVWAGTTKHPTDTAEVHTSFSINGESRFLEDGTEWGYRLSSDHNSLLLQQFQQRGGGMHESYRRIYRRWTAPVQISPTWGAIALLAGHTFSDPYQDVAFDWLGVDTLLRTDYYRNGGSSIGIAYCIIKPTVGKDFSCDGQSETGESRRLLITDVTPTGFIIGGAQATVSADDRTIHLKMGRKSMSSTGIERLNVAQVQMSYIEQARSEDLYNQRRAREHESFAMMQSAYNAVSAVYDAVQQRSAAMGVGSYSAPRTNWNGPSNSGAGRNGAVGDMGGVTSEQITAGHDSVYYSQAEIDSFMTAHRAQNQVAVSPGAAPEAPYDPHYVSTPPPAAMPYDNVSAGRSNSGGASDTAGRPFTAAGTAPGAAKANGSGTLSSDSSGASGGQSASGGASSSGGLIVSSESVDRERVRQADAEAIRLKSIRDREAADARAAAALAASDAAQQAEIQRRQAEQCRLQPAFCDPNAKATPR